jgi:hypothetical protein
MDCNICNKTFTSKANYFIHKREIHSHNNCKYVKCEFCEQDFYSPIFNNNKKIPYYLKCEKCRELQIQLNTNDLKSESYVYKNDTRYFLNKGNTTRVCHVYNCNNETNNNKKCDIHIDINTNLCRGNKCNNYFISNEFNFCENCRDRNNKSKMKSRYNLYDLKIKLGGKCKNCKCTELFKLEFDHINPKFKTKQITKIHPDKLEKELENIQLLCNLCHRIKSFNEQKIKINKSCKDDKGVLVQQIKRQIGGCQICNWTHQNDNILSYCLDFDHIYGEKYKQISNLYLCNKQRILDEIEKCRLICRSCHQMFTCFQRGAKMLDIYYDKVQIENFRNLVDNSINNIGYNIIIKEIVKVYR